MPRSGVDTTISHDFRVRTVLPCRLEICNRMSAATSDQLDEVTSQVSKTEFADISLGIVCPMANEGELATRFVNEVLDECSSAGFRSVKMFVVLDYASKDGTLEMLRQFEQAQSQLHVVWAPEDRNVVDAYLRGYREALDAGCDWILEIDAGYSHQP